MRMSKIKIYYEICKSDFFFKKSFPILLFSPAVKYIVFSYSATWREKMLCEWESSIVKSFKSQTQQEGYDLVQYKSVR